MEVIILIVLGTPVALGVWVIARTVGTRNRIDELAQRLARLEREMSRVKRAEEPFEPVEAVFAKPSPTPVPPKPFVISEGIIMPAPPVMAPPPIYNAPGPERIPAHETKAPVNWEQFMGVKGFAWVGGFALFLGVAFFVKYSFDNNLVPPELRVAIGFLTGLVLLVGGVVMSRKNFPALSQTLCATGVVILYAVTFACRSIYHFQFFGTIPTFVVMALITTTAFLLAARLNALVVAILGMLGGFLTPILLSTGQDNPVGLFGYIALLDMGLILVTMNRRWFFLTALSALGTALLEIGWTSKFFVTEKYFAGNKILVSLGVLLGFNALYLAATWRVKVKGAVEGEAPLAGAVRGNSLKTWLSGSTLGLAAVALGLCFWFLDFQSLAGRPALMFGFVFLLDLVVAAMALLDETVAAAQPVAGVAIFSLLGFWTQKWLTNELLSVALGFYFIFALMHSALPALVLGRGGSGARSWMRQIFPIFALALALFPIFKFTEVSFVVWPFILLIDALAIALAALTATLLVALAALLLTLVATGALIFKISADLIGLPTWFLLLGFFVVFFVAASVWLVMKLKPGLLQARRHTAGALVAQDDLAMILPACSIVLPFLLLIMATLRLRLENPSPLFGLALLLVVLLFGITKLFSLEWMPAIGVACLIALECAWQFNVFNLETSRALVNLVLAWYLIFYAAFAVFPFLFFKQFAGQVVPWASAAMAGALQFFFIHRIVSVVYPNAFMGLLPAAFVCPEMLSLMAILKMSAIENKARMAQIAWFGGMALFFVTLIFPIQFDRQWITIGWALEGAALLWLFHRVPHPGLRLAGVGLLGAAFARLALNPATLDYHPRAARPIFNWYLYAYGMVSLCLFAGASLLRPPRNVLFKKWNIPPILAGLGLVLAFLLLNIEVADYFSAPGATLTFQFSGNFARDMTYSIAWALFALALLIFGIVKTIPAARYAATGLLCVTLLKLFFHDLAQLGQLYRIGAFVGVAVIAMVASFAYQKFFSANRGVKEAGHETSA